MPARTPKIETELMRGAGPLAVLKLLERSEMYGYELVEALDKQTGGVLAMGQSTLYPMLYNLEAKGFIEARHKQSPEGRERKYYRLTGDGKRRLQSDSEQFSRLALALGTLGVLGSARPSTNLEVA